MQEVLRPLRVTKHTIGFGVPHIHDQYIPSYERGDTAYLYNPERMKTPADASELKAMREVLKFPEELAEIVDARMTDIAVRLDTSL